MCAVLISADGQHKIQQGVNVLIAGLVLQLASIIVFFGAYLLFMRQVVQPRNFLDPRFSDIYLSAKFKTSLLCTSASQVRPHLHLKINLQRLISILLKGTQIALALVLVRTVARIAQLSSGMGSTLSQSQVYIPVLDGALILSAVMFITAIPPGPAFGRAWGVTSPSSTKAQRHSATLHPTQRTPDSALHHLHSRSFPSPLGYGYNLTASKEPRSPPPSATAHNADIGEEATTNSRRYSPGWATHKRQQTESSVRAAEIPPYERTANNYTRVPYVPPPAGSLSQQYGQGVVVESQIVVAGSDGSRIGGSGSGGGRRTRHSPRAYQEDLVRHDAIW